MLTGFALALILPFQLPADGAGVCTIADCAITVTPGDGSVDGSIVVTQPGQPGPAPVPAPVAPEPIPADPPEPRPRELIRMPDGRWVQIAGSSPFELGIAPAPITNATVEDLVARGMTHLELSRAPIVISPDPTNNPWKSLIVGYPYWLTNPAKPTSQTLTVDGVTLTITATPASTSINFGDGTTSTCTTMSPYPANTKPGTPSPDCGHAWTTIVGDATLSATTTWRLDWSSNTGAKGSTSTSTTTTQPIHLKELINQLR